MSRPRSALKPSRVRPTADLNITPMIDVLLVSLVIVMVSLPLSQRSLDTKEHQHQSHHGRNVTAFKECPHAS